MCWAPKRALHYPLALTVHWLSSRDPSHLLPSLDLAPISRPKMTLYPHPPMPGHNKNLDLPSGPNFLGPLSPGRKVTLKPFLCPPTGISQAPKGAIHHSSATRVHWLCPRAPRGSSSLYNPCFDPLALNQNGTFIPHPSGPQQGLKPSLCLLRELGLPPLAQDDIGHFAPGHYSARYTFFWSVTWYWSWSQRGFPILLPLW